MHSNGPGAEDFRADFSIAEREPAITEKIPCGIARNVSIVSPEPRDNRRRQKNYTQSCPSNFDGKGLILQDRQRLIETTKQLQRSSPDHQSLCSHVRVEQSGRNVH
jgi:hypothetical protein